MAYMEETYDEDGNASCMFWEAIGADWLDHDFIEVIYGKGRFDYLTPYLVTSDEIETIRGRSRPSDNTFLLVFVDGEDNAAFTPRPTPEPLYVGTFAVQMPVPEPRPKKFDFYEVVKISHPDLPEDCLGYIAGISEDELGVYGYAAWVDAAGEVWSLDEEHLTSMGEFVPEEEVRSGVALQVSQDGELLGVTVGPDGAGSPTDRVRIAIERLKASGLATASSIQGCTEEEIQALESACGLALPVAYREFLRLVGKQAGTFLVGSDLGYKHLLGNQSQARELVVEDGGVWPADGFAFVVHQGVAAVLLRTEDGDDPSVYVVNEDEPLRQVADNFADWLAAAIEDEAGLVEGDNFVIVRDRTDWLSTYAKRIDGGVIEPEQPGVICPCPCCGYPTLPERGGYSICFLCDWEDDGQDDPKADEVWGGPNGSYSLTQARSNFAEFGIMYSSGDHGTPESEVVRQAKRDVCAAYEALRSFGSDGSQELLERLEESKMRLEEERGRSN